MARTTTDARIYSALSRALDEPDLDLFLPPIENGILHAIGLAVKHGEPCGVFETVFDVLWQELVTNVTDREEALESLQIEYTRLFLGPPRPLVPPYEHAFCGDEPVFPGMALRETYRRFGLAVSPTFRDLPDHVCLQLEFTAQLIAAAEIDAADLFFQRHLAGFLPRFADAVDKHTSSPFYAAIAQGLKALAASAAGEDAAQETVR